MKYPFRLIFRDQLKQKFRKKKKKITSEKIEGNPIARLELANTPYERSIWETYLMEICYGSESFF